MAAGDELKVLEQAWVAAFPDEQHRMKIFASYRGFVTSDEAAKLTMIIIMFASFLPIDEQIQMMSAILQSMAAVSCTNLGKTLGVPPKRYSK